MSRERRVQGRELSPQTREGRIPLGSGPGVVALRTVSQLDVDAIEGLRRYLGHASMPLGEQIGQDKDRYMASVVYFLDWKLRS